MANDQLHTIRFKRGSDEFELTGSQEDIARAWTTLAPSVVATFQEDEKEAVPKADQRDVSTQASKKRTQPKRGKRKQPTQDADDMLEKLLGAPLDKFPELGKSPKALYAAFATLNWSNEELGIDGLTASEIREFLLKKKRIKNTAAAYRNALKNRDRAVDFSGSPERFRLMAPGERANAAYVEALANGSTVREAERAADQAEG
jgi:hypothetical protein